MMQIRIIIAAAIVMTLGAASFARSNIYRDQITMWSEIAVKSPHKARSHNNLGNRLMAAGRFREALPHVERALAINPDFMDAWYNLGLILYEMGLPADAAHAFREVIARSPASPQAAVARNYLMAIEKAGRR